MHPVHLLPRPPHAAPHPSKLGKAAPRSMQACQQIGIPVVESAPDPECRHTWREAFVTNWCASLASSLRRPLVPSCRVSASRTEMPCTLQCAGLAAAAPHCIASLRLGGTWLPGACDSATAAGSAERFEHGS